MSQKKALILDDSPTILSYHTSLVESFGFEVETASNGMEALEKVLENHYDLILSDINMPVMDGFEFVKKLRKYSEYEDTPIVFITILDSQSDKTKSLLSGGNLYIVKPIDTEILKEIFVSLFE